MRGPDVGTLQYNDESKNTVFTIVSRSGSASAASGALEVLRRILALPHEEPLWLGGWVRVTVCVNDWDTNLRPPYSGNATLKEAFPSFTS